MVQPPSNRPQPLGPCETRREFPPVAPMPPPPPWPRFRLRRTRAVVQKFVTVIFRPSDSQPTWRQVNVRTVLIHYRAGDTLGIAPSDECVNVAWIFSMAGNEFHRRAIRRCLQKGPAGTRSRQNRLTPRAAHRFGLIAACAIAPLRPSQRERGEQLAMSTPSTKARPCSRLLAISADVSGGSAKAPCPRGKLVHEISRTSAIGRYVFTISPEGRPVQARRQR